MTQGLRNFLNCDRYYQHSVNSYLAPFSINPVVGTANNVKRFKRTISSAYKNANSATGARYELTLNLKSDQSHHKKVQIQARAVY
ncbi:hypothetical protein JYQ62_28645 [Nostoc sp. UHCC 0702]|nr:hypothetical protein JYQ62_28645 [Nostoc sp. UHCC 0702]